MLSPGLIVTAIQLIPALQQPHTFDSIPSTNMSGLPPLITVPPGEKFRAGFTFPDLFHRLRPEIILNSQHKIPECFLEVRRKQK
jgi:hypothetical protein